ncbi:uncharacterized protein LOC115626483 isoform X2 [Scaptodrosophila lebanonensis]|uniref:Uncharacterized protein LOC115626483 isoform X2 n=1 Tax=Drosophila lebanonensis TaxID=7225 RepID=A0A6J2TNW5_DROLE|nr:uncharacterized protein LOC115626483 isoform X2 [Scaptodrosophila lebanonensis]
MLSRHLKHLLEAEQARRQMEITISNNNNVNGPPGVGNGVVMSNEHTVSKNLDLPPTYDEVALNSDSKQFNPALCNDGSTLTIATNLECSNPNLTEGYGEPPAYVPPSTMSTTVVVNNSNMPIV